MKHILVLCLIYFGGAAFANPPELFKYHLTSRLNLYLKDRPGLEQLIDLPNFYDECWDFYGNTYDQDSYDDDASLPESEDEDSTNDALDDIIEDYIECSVELALQDLVNGLNENLNIDLRSNALNFTHIPTWEDTAALIKDDYVHSLLDGQQLSISDVLIGYYRGILDSIPGTVGNFNKTTKLTYIIGLLQQSA